jgi:hypothetical protein
MKKAEQAKFFRTLAKALRNVPANYGTDGYHIDTLKGLAWDIEQKLNKKAVARAMRDAPNKGENE